MSKFQSWRPGFKSLSGNLLDLFWVVRSSKTLATLARSQLLASYQLGFSNPVMFYLDFFFLIIEWSACKLAEYKMRLSALSTVNKLLTFFYKVLTTEGIHKIYYFSLI